MINKVRILRASGNQLGKLEDDINAYIADGWQLVGEIKVIKVDQLDVLVQQLGYVQEENKA